MLTPTLRLVIAAALVLSVSSTTSARSSDAVAADTAIAVLATGDQPTDSTFNPEGMVIDSIEIDNLNIHERLEDGAGRKLFAIADRLRWVTARDVVANEILFKKGDKYSQVIIDETARNLRTRLALNGAWITARPSSNGGVIVNVTTRDRWSLLGNFKIRRDGNETDVEAGINEHNLLGRNILLSFDYYFKQSEENYMNLRFLNQRFRGRKLFLDLNFSDNPRSKLKSLELSHPFYSLSQNYAVRTMIGTEGGRHDEYRDTTIVAEWYRHSDIFELEGIGRWGGYTRKFNLGLFYRYLFQDTYNQRVFVSDTTWRFPTDSVTHQLVAMVAFTDQQFIVEHGIEGFYYDEDLVLEKSVTFRFGRAFTPDFKSRRYDLFSWQTSFAHRFNGNILSLYYARSYWFRAGHTIRETSNFSLLYYNRQLEWMTGVFRARYLREVRDDNRPVLNLGGKSGLRGYDTFFATGDRELLFNAETRIFPGLDILSMLVGPVLFADIGRTWGVGEPFRFNKFHTSLGIGLRLSAEKHTRTQLVRIDLAYAQNHDWHLSFASRQYF